MEPDNNQQSKDPHQAINAPPSNRAVSKPFSPTQNQSINTLSAGTVPPAELQQLQPQPAVSTTQNNSQQTQPGMTAQEASEIVKTDKHKIAKNAKLMIGIGILLVIIGALVAFLGMLIGLLFVVLGIISIVKGILDLKKARI